MDSSQVPAGLALNIEKNVQETFQNYSMSVVLVSMRMAKTKDYLATGGGFIIGRRDTSYLVMTCRHCVVLAPYDVTLSIRLPGKTTEYEAEMLYDNDRADIAIIKVKDVPEPEKHPVLKFRDLTDMAANTAIVQLGYIFKSRDHLNLYPSVVPGSIVTPVCVQGTKSKQDIAYTAAGLHGTSGAAVLLDSKIIGMLCECSPFDQTMFAVSSDTIGIVMRNWLKIPREGAPTIEQMIDQMLAKI